MKFTSCPPEAAFRQETPPAQTTLMPPAPRAVLFHPQPFTPPPLFSECSVQLGSGPGAGVHVGITWELVTPQIPAPTPEALIHQVWYERGDFAFLMGSQGMWVLQVQGPHLVKPLV